MLDLMVGIVDYFHLLCAHSMVLQLFQNITDLLQCYCKNCDPIECKLLLPPNHPLVWNFLVILLLLFFQVGQVFLVALLVQFFLVVLLGQYFLLIPLVLAVQLLLVILAAHVIHLFLVPQLVLLVQNTLVVQKIHVFPVVQVLPVDQALPVAR